MTCQEAAKWLEQQEDLLILTHRRPDGDTVGCAVALCLSLRKLGKTAYILTNEDATALFDSYWGDTLAPAGFEPKAVVSVDIASEGLFHKSAEIYKCQVDLAIDHHGSNEGFAQYNCVEPEKAACGEILYTIITEWFPVDADIALPLYLAISTDTGCFVYSNTTPNTHRVAAALMETGIDYAGVNKRHFRTKSYTRLRVESRIIDTMDLHDEGAIALAAVSLRDMAELGATEEDLEDIAAFVGQLKGVRTAVTIRELKPGECKLSLRTGDGLDASKVCALLGGGGHAAAAGCTVMGSVEEAKTSILWAIRQIQNWN
ncbi:MAG: phosphoesterase RecJ domain-containing protein [Oscillospiraceae bacterium]|nr:phosphoesterase RecJ domain-containing protein [Oscillospiraceae bacterium]